MPSPEHHSVERERERLFYRYYDPIRALSDEDPPWVDPYDEEVTERYVPQSSPDHALTAFCQLGALRLAARRALLFFFDRDQAYVLAEATRTLSLLNDQVYQDERDSLWLGHCRIPRGLLLCENTMNIPAANIGDNRSCENAGDVLIINDLEDQSEFSERPFVKGGPKARFYAGVPLTTSSGVRIGVYCILDDKPRDGLREQDVDFLSELSKTVMAHLEMVHAKTEFSRQSRMLQGLGTFVKDVTTSGPGPPRSRPASAMAQSPTVLEDGSLKEALAAESTSSGRRRQNTSGKKGDCPATDIHDFASDSESETADRRSVGQAQKQFDKQMDKDSGAGAHKALQRAADVIRIAVDADGVVFLDASTQHEDGLSNYRGSGDDTATTTDVSAGNGSDDSFQRSQMTDCRTLGESNRPASPSSTSRMPMREKLLKTLLRRHPQGKVWTFNSDGEVSSTEEGTSDDHSKTKPALDPPRRRTYRRSGAKSSEAERIQKCFPQSRAVCLVPMWDPVRERWFAGAFMWTYSPVRVFSPEGETAYLMAFCDVVMAKIAKREARMTDKAKSDFISSVSHELRSPLHGIIGSLELLQERDSVDRTLLGQIEKCSTTLLDIVEHLLDFAKLDHHASRSRTSGTRHRNLPSIARQDSQAAIALAQAAILKAPESLSKLVEDVADAAFYSHCRALEIDSPVDFILDISVSSDMCIRDEIGAWKRLTMNLVSNALKFTNAGHVAVTLKTLFRKRKRQIAVLTVTDTGCGMSEDFVDSGLFRAFSQENNLTPGTGLGLSVVAKLVKGLGGKIEVQSEKDTGSTFTVAIPLETELPAEITRTSPALPDTARIGLLQPDTNEDEEVSGEQENESSGRRMHLSSIEASLRRIGAELTSSNMANLNLVFAEDLPRLQLMDHKTDPPNGAHLIVLCQTLSSAIELQSSTHSLGDTGHVEYISQPFGPDRLRAAITNCLQAASRRDSTTNGDIVKQATSLLNTLPSHYRRLSDESPTAAARASLLSPTTTKSKPPTMNIANESGPRLKATATKAEQSIESEQEQHNIHDRIVELPTPPESASESADSPEPQTPAETAAPHPRNLSLLLVDDNPVNLRLLTAYADKNKHPRLTATDGQEAIDAYKISASSTSTFNLCDMNYPAGTTSPAPRPDVVFLDINMPVLDGFQAARQIRAFERESRISPTVLIALTCLGSDEAKAEAEACGIDMFLTKPVRPRDLSRILESVAGMVDERQKEFGDVGGGCCDVPAC